MNRTTMMTVFALAASAAMADVKLGGIFSDNMVLQRGKPIPVRGTAEPGEKVTVEYAGKTAEATAGGDGCFRAVLPPLDVEKEGKELVVSGKNRIVWRKQTESLFSLTMSGNRSRRWRPAFGWS